MAVNWTDVCRLLDKDEINCKDVVLVTFSRSGYEVWQWATTENGLVVQDKKGRPRIIATKFPYKDQ